MKQDRFIFGCFSGMIGGIVALLIWSLPAKMLGLTDRLFYDFGMHFVLFKPREAFLDYVVGILAHVGVSGLHGVIFAGLIYVTSSRYLLIKGFIYGFFVWFINLSIGTLFRMPMFTILPANAALVTWVGSGIWGLVTSIAIGIFHNRVASNKNEEFEIHSFVPAPAMKKKRERE